MEELADGGSAGSEGKPMSLVQIHTGHIIRSCRDSAGGEGLMPRQEGDERLGFMTDKHRHDTLLGSCPTKACAFKSNTDTNQSPAGICT